MRALDWNALQFVLALARTGALERAAERLGVDPSTVSRRVRALEIALGVRVFERSMTGHRLTAVGSRLVETAEQVAADIAAMESEAARADERLAGTVRVATSDTISRLHVAPMAIRFARQHPQLSFEIVADQRAANLARRETDMAVRMVRTGQHQVVSRRLATIGHGLYGAREYLAAHPFVGERLEGHTLVAYYEGLGRMPEAAWLDERASGARYAVRANRVDALIEAAAGGIGLAVLPCYMADSDPRLVRLLGPERVVSRDLWLVMHGDSRRIARFRAFSDYLAAEFRKIDPVLRGGPGTLGQHERAPG